MSASSSDFLVRLQRSRNRLHVLVLMALAYLPSLTAAPGKLPADTKLYLYLNPARLTGDAPYSWDSRQFAGWVPHQTLSYLWPSGPWYSLCHLIGVPDWVAHRLWIATLMFAAGLGARWAAKHLGVPATGALIAAMFYQLSPYVLPYVSRTSAMLLPWAGLGWLVGLTIRAATRSKWRDVALFGLVMVTVAAPNATAILMIAPAPALWLLHAAWGRIISWRRAFIVAAKIGAISALMSAWWIAMLSVQGRFGADVLGYSETLQAVSFTSSSAEVLRGMGYWLFYVRDPVGFATTAAFQYMSSGRLIAITFLVLGVSLLGLVLTRWTSRRYAALLVFVGVVLAVGVHPIDQPSPLMSPLANNSRSALSLAMRSSTRALPLSTFGFALGAGALIAALARTRWRLRYVAPWLAGALAIVNLPALFNGGFVDSNLVHNQHPPTAWTEAAKALDAAPAGYRVMQIPGEEFGAFRWGYTVDPPLPSLTNRPFVSRDLLPLGSPAAMDTIYALDDRFQEGTAELSSVAPIARLFGADTLWLPNDAAFERFRTPRPELISQMFSKSTAGLGATIAYGTPTVNTPQLPMVDEQSISSTAVGTPVAPVGLVPVLHPQPIERAKTSTVVVAGSGDGLVDAAAAGVLTGNELVQYAADLKGSGTALAQADRVIVTDSNRDRAHQWRGSQDVTGFTEDGSAGAGVLRFDSADQRIPVFAVETSADMTIAEQRGAVHAAASSYGEPFAYRPEDRAAMAVDGDLTTAWLVADHFEATGEFLQISTDAAIDHVTLVQPRDDRNRWITAVTISDASGSYPIALTDASRSSSGQTISLHAPSRRVTIGIDATATDVPDPGQGQDAVGFAEVITGLGHADEIVRTPSNVLSQVTPSQPLDIVLTRLRTRPTNRYRGDTEMTLTRSFTLSQPRTFAVSTTARISQRADDATLASLIGWTGTTSNQHLVGVPAMGGWAATDGDLTTAWVSPIGKAIGSTLHIPLSAPQTISTITFRQPVSEQFGVITQVSVGNGSTNTIVNVPPPDANGVSTLVLAPLAASALDLTIAGTNHTLTLDRRYGERVELPAGISEVSTQGIVATPLPAQLDTGCRRDLLGVDGSAVPIRITGSLAEMFADQDATVSSCDAQPLQLGVGEHIVRTTSGLQSGIDINRLLLTSAGSPVGIAAASSPAPKVTVLDVGRTSRTLSIAPCATACWFVFGEGFNVGWHATVSGTSLGTQQQVDGGFNGWLLPPSATARTIELTWTGQNTVNVALFITAMGLVLCLALIVFDRRRTDAPESDPPVMAPVWGRPARSDARRVNVAGLISVAVAATAATVVIGASWGLACGLIAVLCSLILRRPHLLGVAAILIAVDIGAVMLHRVRAAHPFVNAGWPGVFDDLHRPGMAVVVLLLASVSMRRSSVDPASR
jgi:arabinofuranan 3-O-arabinosyltransferase